MGLLNDVWQWLSFEEHREPLKLIAGALVTVIAAAWAVFKYIISRRASQKQESVGSRVPSVPKSGVSSSSSHPTDMFDVFLSHNSADKETVEAIAGALVKFGVKPFLDKWHLVPGRAWIGGLEEALQRSSTMAVFIGPSSFGPVHLAEKDVALLMHFQQGKPVIPVLLCGARKEDVPPFLQTLGWVDFRDGIENPEELQKFLAGIRQLPPEEFQSIVRQTGNPYADIPAGTSPDSVKTSLQEASGALMRWPQTLAADKWLDRPELERIREYIRSKKRSVTLLLGEPGSGKSALLARLGKDLGVSGVAVLGIKADTLDSGISDQTQLAFAMGLSAPIHECISALSWREPVVLLVDQLDALADLVDLHSKRLSLLLDLIYRLSNRDNVHIVASCRIFEYRHDPRLRGIEADIRTLALPPWEEVEKVLQEMGFLRVIWPLDFQEVLRVPRNLHIFQEVAVPGGEAPPFSSYHAMLEALWSQKVVIPGGGRVELVDEIAQEMARDEVLWLPLVRFQDRTLLIEALEREGILRREGLQVGFRHQSLFEFAHARTFVRREGGLAETVLRRQNALFIRPHLWQALHYLRMADMGTYRREVGLLWGNKDLRQHVRFLLIEFLGQLARPEDFEARWILPLFGPRETRVRVLRAVEGSPGWFARLHVTGHLDAMMAEPPETAIEVLLVLRSAAQFARGAVLELLDRNWLPHPEKDFLSFRVLDDPREVDEPWVERICSVLSRSNFAGYMVDHLAEDVSKVNPDLAPPLVRAYLERALEAERRVKIPEIPPLPEGATADEEFQRYIETKTHTPFVNLLESTAHLDHLPHVAERAPSAFLEALWPWIEELLQAMADDQNPYRVEYRGDRSADTALPEEQGRRNLNPLVVGFEKAITILAERSASTFLEFARLHNGTDMLLLQRLLARGMERLVGSHSGVVLEFLSADPRRLVLGGSSDCHMESKRLIKGLVPHLSDPERARLEDYIRQWRIYRNVPGQSAKERMERRRWEREHRLRVMRAFPKEHMRVEFRRFIEEEERAFPNLKDWDCYFSEVTWTGSPITADRMVHAQDEHLLELFSELKDRTGWDHPRRFWGGGAIQAAREFCELAKKEPERVAALVLKLTPGENELPAGHALEGLSNSIYPKERLYRLIEVLVGMGFASPTFRHYAASAVERIVDKEHPLPDSLFRIMETWLEETDPKDYSVDKEEDSKIKSVIWGASYMRVLPSGNYPVLHALSRACLLSDPPNIGRWLDMLEAHLERREDPEVWRALSAELRWLNLAERERAQAFLDRLFLRFPTVLGSRAGATLIARVQNWADELYLEVWLSALRDGPWVTGATAYGELLLLRCAFHSESPWLIARLEELRRVGNTGARISAMRQGIAYSAAHLWGEQRARTLATDILVECMADDVEEIRDAASEVFRVMAILPRDSDTDRLLDAVVANPSVLRGTNVGSLIERLEVRASEDPERVYQICTAMLDSRGRELGDMSRVLYGQGKYVVNIALTLQRLEGEHRERGLQIFERLMELDIHTAKETLEELDRRSLPRKQ